MLALYRSERQAEALEAYRQAARSELSDELGLEPSESLKQLEAAILRQDPELAPRRRSRAACRARRSSARARAARCTNRTLDALDASSVSRSRSPQAIPHGS